MAQISDQIGMQWQNSSSSTEGRGIRSEEGKFDPATVIGLKNNDRVLVIGNPSFISWLTPEFEKKPDHVVSVNKISELEKLIEQKEKFDKIIISRGVRPSTDHLLAASNLLERARHGLGLFIFFPRSEQERDQMLVALDFYYPDSRFWELDTTAGPVVCTENVGASWRMVF